MTLAANASQGSSGIQLLIFMVVIFGAMYLLMIRPQQARRRQYMELIRSVQVGDEIETIAGIFGTIRRLDEETAWVEIAAGTTVKMSRSAIRRKVTHEESDERA